jgi:hypothetical protein
VRPLQRRELAVVVVLAVAFGAGPTVGDIGACGRTATPLDIPTFAATRKAQDCSRCTQCGFMTQYCMRACDPGLPSDVFIPSTCFPLAHDGDVCLDALEAASCSDYAGFVSDTAPSLPTECEFCRYVPDGGP